jgi:hypothetical protein
MSDISILLLGCGVLLITGVIFWYCLPGPDGKVYRLADTEFEPYVGVAFCAGIALSCTMILSSLINMFGARPPQLAASSYPRRARPAWGGCSYRI